MSGWWENAVVYQIYPRSFQDSDGDGVGDLPGVLARIDYLASLGVDAIWLSPIYPSPGHDLGYDVADYCDVDPLFGSIADLDRLIEACHGRGIRLLLDLVPSHTSIEHPWFREHPDRYVWSEDGPANNWVACFGGPAWSRDPDSGRWYLHSFFPEQPDLDWRNPDVHAAIAGVIRFWLERGVDGFRVDAADRLAKDEELRDDPPASEPFPFPIHPEAALLEPRHSRASGDLSSALRTMREAAGDAYLVGEVYLPAPHLWDYLAYFDSAFSFDLLHSPWEPASLRRILTGDAAVEGIAWVVSNHDFSRVATRWGEENARTAAMLLLTLPGPAFIYQGEEIGMTDGPGGEPQVDPYGRDAFRHPMQWRPEPGGGFTVGEPWLPEIDPEERNVADQDGDPESMLELHRGLISFRRRLEGPIELLDPGRSEGTIEFRRGRHLISLNATGSPQPASGAGEVLLATAEGALVDGELAPRTGVIRELAGGSM